MNLHCDLDLVNNNLIFTQSTQAYADVHPSLNLVAKKINISAETVISDQMSPHCDPELEQDSKPICLHDTLAHNMVTKCSVVQTIPSGQTFTNIVNLCCDLDLEGSNPIFPQNTLAYGAVFSYQVCLQTDQQFRRYSKNNGIFII